MIVEVLADAQMQLPVRYAGWDCDVVGHKLINLSGPSNEAFKKYAVESVKAAACSRVHLVACMECS